MPENGTAGVRRQYHREAGRYDRRWAGYLAGTLGPTLDALGEERPARLLDAGCGTGLLLERVAARWPGAGAVGVDASPEMVARARRRLPAGVSLVLADVHRLPFASGSFDAVLSSSSLHHWRDPAGALRELARATRPGARLALTDWSADFPSLRLFSRLLRLVDPSHHRSYRLAELTTLVEEAGFRVESARRYRVGWWGMMTLRARRR